MSAHAAQADCDALQAALDTAYGLTVLADVVDDSVSRAVIALLRALAEPDTSTAALAAAYGAAFRVLADAATHDPVPGLPDAWQAHLTARLVDEVNPWSVQAEQACGGTAPGLAAQAARDLANLRRLYDMRAELVQRLAQERVAAHAPALAGAWGPWLDLGRDTPDDDGTSARASMRRRLDEASDWAALVPELESYWARHGAGLTARFRMLRWDKQTRVLAGIAHPDPIVLSELVGYDAAHALLTTNVERFLVGLPAHDALLYGAPGTGKSSTVKAIANTYADRGLRLVEAHKEDLRDLPAIAASIRGRAPRFLLFVDDLSFEEHQTEYKALKALLEGTAEARPRNLLIYATTNRRNLVRENFADRGLPSDDVHGRDTMQEKISLAARFGLRVTFAVPDQEGYLAIATALARGRRLPLTDDEVRARALLWERQHPGRSGRLARQFVDDLEGEVRAGIAPTRP